MASEQKTKAVAYMRTGLSETVEQLDDLWDQYKKIQKYTESNQIEITASFKEAPTGEKSRLYDILEYCRLNKDIETIVAVSQNRVTRSHDIYKEWDTLFRSINVKFEFVGQSTLSGSDKFMKSLKVVLAVNDSNIRSEYIKRGLLRKVQSGYSVQKPPKGYTRTLQPGLFAMDSTASFLRSNIKDFISGKLSYENLRCSVSQLYFKDKALSRSKFEATVSNPYYAGHVSLGGKQYEGLHEPLLTDAEYQKLIALLSK